MPKRIVAEIVSALLLIGVFILAFNIQSAQSEAHTIVVPDDYPTIQGAINAASPGDTVIVYAGTYNESVTVNKTLTVVSQSGPSNTIISLPNSSNATDVDLFNVTANNVTISGFTVTAIVGWGSKAINLANVEFCNISNNVCYGNGIGISLYQSDYNTIVNNDVSDNQRGIYLSASNYNLLMNNTASRSTYSAGITLFSSSNNQILNNTANSNVDEGIYLMEKPTTNNLIANNTISSNPVGLFLFDCPNNTMYHNNFINNTQQAYAPHSTSVWDNGHRSGGNYWSDYHGADEKTGPNQNRSGSDGIGDSPYVIDANNTDRYPLMAPFGSLPTAAKTIIVPDDYSTIQGAVDAARAGDIIFVRNGGYREKVTVNKALTLVGEDRNSTHIVGPCDWGTYWYGWLSDGTCMVVVADNVTITGFTIESGAYLDTSGAALTLSGVKGVNVTGNYITGNPYWGSTFVIRSSSNCTFSGNYIERSSSSANSWLFDMSASYFNTFFENDFGTNALHLTNSSNNLFFRNNMAGVVLDDLSINNWNGTYNSGGNYWNDYTGVDLKKGTNQDQPDGDGVGDTPYVINSNNTDHYPLMRPYAQFLIGVPFADFSYAPNEPFAGENATFNASASYDINDGNIISYAWDFGDGATSTSASPIATHAYAAAGNFQINLTITDNDGQTDTKTISITVKMIPTNVSMSTSSSSMFAGFRVNITGTLTDMYGNGLKDRTVVLSYTFSGISTWTPITSCTTDNAGNYLATWIPTATGAFTLNASWSGDAAHSATNNTTTLNCLTYDQYVFSVESNSTISGLAFNAAGQMLSFTATGPDGTAGYVRATVTKNLTANLAGVKVLIDGTQIACSPTSTSDSCLIYFTYQHSTHSVAIDLSAAAQPTPTPTPSPTATPTPTPTPTSSPTSQPTITPTPTSNPTSTLQPEETPLANWLLILIPVAVVIVIIALVVALRRKKLHKPQTS